MEFRKFRKKPIIIEAFQWFGPGYDYPSTPGQLIIRGYDSVGAPIHKLAIPTLDGVMYASEDDWIIRGVNGEYYPCKPDIFAKTYDVVEEQNG